METQVNEKTEKTKKEVNFERIENYLKATSKHLFLTKDKKFFKAFAVKIKEKPYCVTLEFDGNGKDNICIFDVGTFVDNYGNCAKHILSGILFPINGEKKASISNFKAMKEKMVEVKKFIEETYDGSNGGKVESEIKKMLNGLVPKED